MFTSTKTDWKLGEVAPATPVSNDALKPLKLDVIPVPLWTSNNPEKVESDGWLMQNSGSSKRGGQRFPLRGTFRIYLYHKNDSGQDKFLHVIITNPDQQPISIRWKGVMHDDKQFPFTGKVGSGPSFHVARSWLNNQCIEQSATIQPKKGYEIAKIPFGKDRLVDGRFEVTSSGETFVYTIVTSNGDLNQAINATQGEPAKGEINQPDRDKLGRCAGVCKTSGWQGTIDIEIPTGPAYLGLCLNTCSPQNQTAEYAMHLSDSAARSYGNYGQEYNLVLRLGNPSTSKPKKVRLSFAHHETKCQNLTFTYNGSILINGRLVDVFTTPKSPKQTLLESLTLDPGATTDITLRLIVPGSITLGHQLILESLPF